MRLAQQLVDDAPTEVVRVWFFVGEEARNRNGLRLEHRLIVKDLASEEAVRFLLHIVVGDARKLFLPHFEAVHFDVILNVLKALLQRAEFISDGNQRRVQVRNRQQVAVQLLADAVHQFFADAVFQQLLRLHLNHSEQRRLHIQDAFGKHTDLMRIVRQIEARVHLCVLFQHFPLKLERQNMQRGAPQLRDMEQHIEHGHRHNVEHAADKHHQLLAVVLAD
mmetsp:Transcript_12730/g.20246  ORF Transcript_12730/g.20246 Transcript_12730/m.20246 type:complete len:221 (-) Transcript_12730:810-1472(-)